MPTKTENTVLALLTAAAWLALVPCAAVAVLAPAAAMASTPRVSIAATVNDDVITKEDVDSRLALYLAGNPHKPPPNVRVQLEKQVLDKLIDEKLELQEAQNLGIVVEKTDIDNGFADIADQNYLKPDEFKQKLQATGIDLGTLYDQIKAELAWSQVVRRKLGPEVNVSEGDINSAVDMLNRNKGKAVYQVAEILLTVPSDARDGEVRMGAEKLIDQISHGAPFSAVARQFSQAPGAANGGDLGWVQQGQLDPKLDAALQKMHTGQLSAPIRTDKGYHILFLRDEHVIGSDQKTPEEQAAAQAAEEDAQQPQKADDAAGDKDAKAAGDKDAAKTAGDKDAKDDKDAKADAAKPEMTEEEKTRATVANQIGMHRLGQMQEQYLSDLRANAFIDKRL